MVGSECGGKVDSGRAYFAMKYTLPIKCTLPEGFLDEETRAGFLVDSKLKQIWAIEIDLYLEFARICEKHGIKYQIFGGSLLGAVRHQGFIPWDDDLDVAMTRDEYRKFIEVAPKELSEPYFLQTALTDRKFFCSYARLRNSLTTGVIEWFASPQYNNGIYLDIYVLDGRAETAWQNFVQQKLRWVAEKLVMATACPCNATATTRKFYMLLRPFAMMIPWRARVAFYDWTMTLYNKRPKAWNQNTHGDYKYKYGLTAEQWDAEARLPFEWFDVPAPSDYDGVLKAIYGEYMKLPSAELRGKWHEGVVHFEPTIPYKEYLQR